MPDPTPLTGAEVVVGCVTESNPKYLAQTLRLVQSIRWFGGGLAQSRILVCAAEHLDSAARRALEQLDCEIHIVPRLHRRNPPSNRLQWFELGWNGPEEILLTLDCDTIVVRDPLPLLHRDGFQAKVAPLPTVTHEVFERLFAHYGMPLPARSYTTGYTGTPTIPYFNAGVIAMPRDVARKFVPSWRRFNCELADHPELVAPCAKHLHQAALALALAETGVPVRELPVELNFQLNMTQFPSPPAYLKTDPTIIHYHQLASGDGYVLPTLFPGAQKRIEQFNSRLREERARHPQAHAQPIAVLGMHRSGTSVVANVLSRMGAYCGDREDLTAPDVHNPAGYWERRDVVRVNDDVLQALDADWREPAAAEIAELHPDARHGFVERTKEIARVLDAHGTWMVKDPRLSLLLPLWREAIPNPTCVLVWRDPDAVARSLRTRDGLPLPIGLALWEEYTRSQLEVSEGLPRVLICYDELIADPLACITQLHASLAAAGVRGLKMLSQEELGMIVEPALDRQSGGEPALLTKGQEELRASLRSGAALRGKPAPIDPQTREMLVAYVRHERAEGRFVVNAEVRQLDRLLAEVFASRSWKIGFAVTRLLRKLRPSHEPTALERWEKIRARRQNL